MDEWMAADSLDHLLGDDRLVWTVANAGAAAAASNGADFRPWQLVEWAEEPEQDQTMAEQMAILETLEATAH